MYPQQLQKDRILNWDLRTDVLEKEMATHSSTPAWKIPWMEEPCGLQSMGSQQSNLSCSYFPFSTLNILCHSLLAFRFSVEKSANSLMGTPLDTTFCFSVAACKKSLFIFIL